MLKRSVYLSILISFLMVVLLIVMPKVNDVHEIRRNPGAIKKKIRVIGSVSYFSKNRKYFFLKDINRKCKVIPIAYDNKKPEAGEIVIVYGKVRKVDKVLQTEILWYEYLMVIDEIKGNRDGFFYFASYRTRQWMHNAGLWVFARCELCRKLRRVLASSPLYY